jgi:hypothetical protein
MEFLLRVELPGASSISQKVRPEDKMASNSQNGDIITLLYLRIILTQTEDVFLLTRM